MLALALLALVAGDAKTDDRILVYVDDVQPGDKTLAPDSSALTTALCAALGKDKRIDVLCAPDVKQILNFAATAAMVGTNGGPSGAIQDRLERTKHVVSSSFKKDGGKYVLVVKAGPKAADAQASALYSDKPLVALEEKADQQRAILDKMASLATRISAAILPAPGAGPAPPPPAPLAKKDAKPAPSGGW